MNGSATSQNTAAAAMMISMTRPQSFEYRQAARQDPNVSSPARGTTASMMVT